MTFASCVMILHSLGHSEMKVAKSSSKKKYDLVVCCWLANRYFTYISCTLSSSKPKKFPADFCKKKVSQLILISAKLVGIFTLEF